MCTYFCESESILYTVVKVKVFGNIWQIATSALTQASFTNWKWNLTHRASFRNIYKKTSQGKFDRIKGKLILIISTVHHPSTEHWEQPYLAYLQIEARLNTHKLRPWKKTNLTFLISHLIYALMYAKHQELHMLYTNDKWILERAQNTFF